MVAHEVEGRVDWTRILILVLTPHRAQALNQKAISQSSTPDQELEWLEYGP